MQAETKTRKTPIPQKYESIIAGVLKLSLADRIKIKDAILETNKAELESKQAEYEAASRLVNGK